MAIIAKNSGTPRELIPAGNYVARAYSFLHIGTVIENFQGESKLQNKVRIGWELPTELKVFKEENGEQPLVISKEYSLSMNEKANLRKMLASWRGKDFSEDEAKGFDITKLVGVPCMLNIIHKPSKDGTKTYEEIGSISPMPKGMQCPAQVNANKILQYDAFDNEIFDSLPDFIKDKIKSSQEYAAMQTPKHQTHVMQPIGADEEDDQLPF